jgi:branched-chain amino acid transport system ATP-binding protein
VLEVERLAAGYAGMEVLRDISLRVDTGEIVSLLGANGAGKSTLLRSLSGLIPPSRGAIRLDGHDISHVPAHQRVALGLVQVPEGRHILANLTVRENLRLGAFIHRRDRGYLEESEAQAYSLFPILRERAQQPAGLLSGGEQQMLALARALMSRPRVLLLDEPSLGLAPQVVAQIFGVVRRLRDDGMPILLVEQNARKALEIADRGVVLRRGQIVLAGPANELRDNPAVQHAYLGGG